MDLKPVENNRVPPSHTLILPRAQELLVNPELQIEGSQVAHIPSITLTSSESTFFGSQLREDQIVGRIDLNTLAFTTHSRGLLTTDTSQSGIETGSPLEHAVMGLGAIKYAVEEQGGDSTIELYINRQTQESGAVLRFDTQVTAQDGNIITPGTRLFFDTLGNSHYLEQGEVVFVDEAYHQALETRLSRYFPGVEAPEVGNFILIRPGTSPTGERITEAVITDASVLLFETQYVSGDVNIRTEPTTTSQDIGDLSDYPQGLRIISQGETDLDATTHELFTHFQLSYNPDLRYLTKEQDGYTWVAVAVPTGGVEVVNFIALLNGTQLTQAFDGPPTPEGVGRAGEVVAIELTQQEMAQIVENAPRLYDYQGNLIPLGVRPPELINDPAVPYFKQTMYGVLVGDTQETTISIPDRKGSNMLMINVVYGDFIVVNDSGAYEVRRYVLNNWENGLTSTERFTTEGVVPRASLELNSYGTGRIREEILRPGYPYRLGLSYIVPNQLEATNSFFDSYAGMNPSLEMNSALMIYFGNHDELSLVDTAQNGLGYISQIGYIPQ